jgi:hypothetical protein
VRCCLHVRYVQVVACSTGFCSVTSATPAVLLAALDADGKPRADKAVAWSLQRYLIFAVRLSCAPPGLISTSPSVPRLAGMQLLCTSS